MKTMCGMVYVYGDLETREQLTRPLREFGPPAFALGHPAPYPAVQSMFDGLLPHGLYHYWKADFVDNLTEQAIAGHVRYGARIPTVHSAVHIYPLDGAVHDVAADQTAFAYRDVKFTQISPPSAPTRAHAAVPRVGTLVLVRPSSLLGRRSLRELSDG